MIKDALPTIPKSEKKSETPSTQSTATSFQMLPPPPLLPSAMRRSSVSFSAIRSESNADTSDLSVGNSTNESLPRFGASLPNFARPTPVKGSTLVEQVRAIRLQLDALTKSLEEVEKQLMTNTAAEASTNQAKVDDEDEPKPIFKKTRMGK